MSDRTNLDDGSMEDPDIETSYPENGDVETSDLEDGNLDGDADIEPHRADMVDGALSPGSTATGSPTSRD